MTDSILPVGADGFLLSPADWTEQRAAELAATEGLILTDAHWEIVRFTRDFYQTHGSVPPNRLFARAISQALGPDKGNSAYLLSLFPGSPVRLAAKLAGLPKPSHCF